MSFNDKFSLRHLLIQKKNEVPPIFINGNISIIERESTQSISNQDEIKNFFPLLYGKKNIEFREGKNPNKKRVHNVGVILSGGQAPGGHNVIAGLYEALKNMNHKSKLYGFKGGPGGLIHGEYIEITKNFIDVFRNMGGFDMIGSGRTKLEKASQFKEVHKNCRDLDIDGIIIIGGDDSNTNAALLAEYFIEQNEDICVIGVPKTIDGDLKNDYIEISFGFDTASKVYSDLVGNIQRDANSSKKYWHFIKVMGRSASHLALEVALSTHPNITIISEEILHNNINLEELINQITNIICKRSLKKKNFGTVILPEGLLEFIPDIKFLIEEINLILGTQNQIFKSIETFEEQIKFINKNLTSIGQNTFKLFPKSIQRGLLEDRDDHGNICFSKIEIEKLIIELCAFKINKLKKDGLFKGKFSWQSHFLGYEGRCSFPSHFDSQYSYSLGHGAFFLLNYRLSGHMVTIKNTTSPIEEWIIGGVPITSLMNMEIRMGQQRPVIKKTLVDLNGKPYQQYLKNREDWKYDDQYQYPGPIQHFGPKELVERINYTLLLEQNYL